MMSTQLSIKIMNASVEGASVSCRRFKESDAFFSESNRKIGTFGTPVPEICGREKIVSHWHFL